MSKKEKRRSRWSLRRKRFVNEPRESKPINYTVISCPIVPLRVSRSASLHMLGADTLVDTLDELVRDQLARALTDYVSEYMIITKDYNVNEFGSHVTYHGELDIVDRRAGRD